MKKSATIPFLESLFQGCKDAIAVTRDCANGGFGASHLCLIQEDDIIRDEFSQMYTI